MRRSMFGDFIAESTEDDIGEAFLNAGLDPDECYAILAKESEGEFSVEIYGNEVGDTVVSTDDGMFATDEAARKWAKGWVEDVQSYY